MTTWKETSQLLVLIFECPLKKNQTVCSHFVMFLFAGFYGISYQGLGAYFENRPISQLNSILGKRCDSLSSKKSTSYNYVATTRTKQLHAMLRAMHASEIQIHIESRQVMFPEEFQKN